MLILLVIHDFELLAIHFDQAYTFYISTS